MKNLLTTCLKLALLTGALFVAVAAQAQNGHFEGSFSYAIRLSGKQAQQFLMNDPPNKMDVHTKGDNFIVNLSGGRIPRTFLFIGDSNQTYIVDPPNRRAFYRTYYTDTTKTIPEAVPTGETTVIRGIECQEYKVEKPEENEVILYYVNDQYRIDTELFEGKDDAKADFLTKGLDGRIPFRKIIKTPELTTELDLIMIKSQEHDIENFRIPEGFKIRGRDPRK